MDHRHVTPPTALEIDDVDDFQCPGGSASTTISYLPQDWSPATVMTNVTTPDRSPFRMRDNGARLLPRPRDQDQIMEPSSAQDSFQGHQRTTSLPSNTFYAQFDHTFHSGPEIDRRSVSPHGHNVSVSPLGVSISPASAPSPYSALIADSATSRRPSLGARSVSTSNLHTHGRSVSSSSATAYEISRYGFPYRQGPAPQPVGVGVAMSRPPTALSHLTPIPMAGGMMQSYPNNRRTASPPANPSRLSVELEVPEPSVVATTTVLQYLTSKNPTPALTQRITEPIQGLNTHFWFDVRNLRAWSDFNVATIASMPSMLRLLNINIPESRLPTPAKVNLDPEVPSQLAEICAKHHAVKINAALKVAQGSDRHMAMRSYNFATGARPQPEFIANYESDEEKTIFGDGRGRVVGIVKCYQQWNSGMRHGDANVKVQYLRHLAHLHRYMRDHGTRYGFIITEIEVVCVRMGGPPRPDNVPLFGYLEIAPPVQISASGLTESGNMKMTAGLALWYLHMLAKEQPFPGQFHWKLQVDGPKGFTRSVHIDRDDWMPKHSLSDKRNAKRVRGWFMPDEPLHKKEIGREKTRRS